MNALPIEIEKKIFMRAKSFAENIGVSYNIVLDWIHGGMPIMPDKRNPYLIIVPAAIEWLKRKYGFEIHGGL